MMSRRKKVVLGVVGLIGLLTVVGIAIGSQREQGVEVRTEVVARRDLVSMVAASGFIQAKRKVDISSDISGRVTNLYVEEGQWVNQGDILLRIDPTSYEANVRRANASVAQARAQAAQAQANVTRAESELERAELLAPQQLISPAELEQARTQVMVVRAQMEAAEHGVAQAEASLSETLEQLRKTTISAPMSGQVTRLNIEAGETAVVGTMNNAGSLLLTIADLSEMEARVRVGETDIPSITHGDSASIRIDAYPDKVFSGRVSRISNSAVNAPTGQTTTQTAQAIDFEVIVTLDAPPPDLRPDLTATADIVTATRSQVLSVPIIAVTVRDEEGRRFQVDEEQTAPAASETEAEVEGVFVLREGSPVWVPVALGIVGDWYFEVTGGLQGGETVIAGPYAAIRDLEPRNAVRVTGAATDGTPAEALEEEEE
jgi:HlyD family secretion protein